MAPKLKRGSTLIDPVVVKATGVGVEELAKKISDSTVSWALLRFQVGSGTFSRLKIVSVTCQGDNTPAVHRGRLMSRTPDVLQLFGHTHADLEVTSAEDLSVESMYKQLTPVFEADNLGEYSLAAMQADLEKANEAAKAAAVAAAKEAAEAEAKAKEAAEAQAKEAAEAAKIAAAEPADDAEDAKGPKKKKNPGVSKEDGLEALGTMSGKFNWMILEPKNLEVHDVGFGGIEELKESLDADNILFGLMRFTFPREKAPPIVKYLFIHWIGPEVSAVKRAQLNAKQKAAADEFRSVCSITFSKTAYTPDDLKLEELISDLKQITYDTADSSDRELSVDWYREALSQEMQETMASYGAKGRKSVVAAHGDAPEDETDTKEEQKEEEEEEEEEEPEQLFIPVQQAVSTVRKPDSEFNWVLMETIK